MSISAIITAAGSGRRMGGKKQYQILKELPVLAYSFFLFAKCRMIDHIYIVLPEGDMDYFIEELAPRYGITGYAGLVAGGSERQQSVYNALSILPEDTDLVVIHDAARPFVTEKILIDTIKAAREYGGATAAVPAWETICIADNTLLLQEIPDRKKVWLLQTPQCFDYRLLLQAHEKAKIDAVLATDDTAVAALVGVKSKMVESSKENIKITTPEDLQYAVWLLERGAD